MVVSTDAEQMAAMTGKLDFILDTVPVRHDLNPYLNALTYDGKHILVGLLDTVAKGPYHALIDTGALVTGFSNLDVARYLLENGLAERGMEGAVYLDAADRKMVLTRSGKVMPLDRCSIAKDRRFSFYDQIHTTGMDI